MGDADIEVRDPRAPGYWVKWALALTLVATGLAFSVGYFWVVISAPTDPVWIGYVAGLAWLSLTTVFAGALWWRW